MPTQVDRLYSVERYAEELHNAAQSARHARLDAGGDAPLTPTEVELISNLVTGLIAVVGALADANPSP
jgi:hypothetical protein